MNNEELMSVRERLERIKEKPKEVPKPLDIIPEKDRRPIGDGMLTFERQFLQKVEKAIKKIESIKDQMKSSDNFLNYFYDLKNAEQDFLKLLNEAEEKHVDFPENFVKRVAEVKKNIRSKVR
ncbi:MAG: hypothetical protein KKA79_09700 [Nanoarchaeota archaeon]|nr:hypothetical protein [Nanoarchaeota archaeon]MCG2718619.1 hypothetical protein [Nanoarchaeota archaeon]